MRGCGKVLVWLRLRSATGLRELRSQTFGLCSVTGEENNFLFPCPDFDKLSHRGWKIVYLIDKISEMKQTNPSRTSFADYVCAQDDIGYRNTGTRDGFCAAEWDNGYGKLSHRIEENCYIRF